MTIVVSTDGSALSNPNGPMGWAWADHDSSGPGHQHSGDCACGGASNGTNQIGELCAVLEAVRAHPGPEELIIESDSQYAISCSSRWVHGWKKRGWKNSKNEPVKNVEIIKAIDHEISHRAGPVKFKWVKGHAGNPGNEKCDMLARGYAEDCKTGKREGFLPKEGWQSLISSPYSDGLKIPPQAKMLLDGELSEEEARLSHIIENGDSSLSKEEFNGQLEVDLARENARRHNEDPDREEKELARTHADQPTRTYEERHVQNQDGEKTPAEPQTESSASSKSFSTSNLTRVSGLSVSGELTFSPPPSSSPSYDGKPRKISGFIEIDGYVEADGTISISNAPFHLHS